MCAFGSALCLAVFKTAVLRVSTATLVVLLEAITALRKPLSISVELQCER